MTWRLTEAEAAELEARVIKQLRAEARQIIAAEPEISDRALLYRLMWRGYRPEELIALNQLQKSTHDFRRG